MILEGHKFIHSDHSNESDITLYIQTRLIDQFVRKRDQKKRYVFKVSLKNKPEIEFSPLLRDKSTH